ncbi:MAG: DUF2007 domain-containing protein [Candidatus Rokubacteria bacterium]|nr:DUF2007 domain-containing protein [Candidatus Rokubacteria bacterium]
MGRRAKVIRLQVGPRPPTPAPAADEPAAGGLVEVRRCRDQAEALVVRALLDSEGIASVLRGHLVQSLHPFSVGDQAEVTVLVPAPEGPRAREVLGPPPGRPDGRSIPRPRSRR